jgi:hypothetical protein
LPTAVAAVEAPFRERAAATGFRRDDGGGEVALAAAGESIGSIRAPFQRAPMILS